jgi:hypothetical protein
MVFESLRTPTKRPGKPSTLILTDIETTMNGDGKTGRVIEPATLSALPLKTETPLRNTTLLALPSKTENPPRTMILFSNHTTTLR